MYLKLPAPVELVKSKLSVNSTFDTAVIYVNITLVDRIILFTIRCCFNGLISVLALCGAILVFLYAVHEYCTFY